MRLTEPRGQASLWKNSIWPWHWSIQIYSIWKVNVSCYYYYESYAFYGSMIYGNAFPQTSFIPNHFLAVNHSVTLVNTKHCCLLVNIVHLFTLKRFANWKRLCKFLTLIKRQICMQ